MYICALNVNLLNFKKADNSCLPFKLLLDGLTKYLPTFPIH